MFKKYVLPFVLLSSTAFSQGASTIDPMEQILNKLNSIESRLDAIEDKEKQPKSSQKNIKKDIAPTSKKIENTPHQLKKDELIGGAIVNIKHVNSKKHGWINDPVHSESFAGYIASTSKITTLDIYKNSLGYKGPYALTTEGYFHAKEQGLYSFGVLHEKNKQNNGRVDCSTNIIINDQMISEEQGRLEKRSYKESSILANGSVSLDPGIYEYSVNSVCGDYIASHYITRSFMVKAPSDLSMRLMTDKEIFNKK